MVILMILPGSLIPIPLHGPLRRREAFGGP